MAPVPWLTQNTKFSAKGSQNLRSLYLDGQRCHIECELMFHHLETISQECWRTTKNLANHLTISRSLFGHDYQ